MISARPAPRAVAEQAEVVGDLLQRHRDVFRAAEARPSVARALGSNGSAGGGSSAAVSSVRRDERAPRTRCVLMPVHRRSPRGISRPLPMRLDAERRLSVAPRTRELLARSPGRRPSGASGRTDASSNSRAFLPLDETASCRRRESRVVIWSSAARCTAEGSRRRRTGPCYVVVACGPSRRSIAMTRSRLCRRRPTGLERRRSEMVAACRRHRSAAAAMRSAFSASRSPSRVHRAAAALSGRARRQRRRNRLAET